MRPEPALGLFGEPASTFAPRLELRGVTKRFRSARGEVVGALEDVTFTVGTGEFVCLVGPTGSGKTTIVNLLAGLERPDEGTILVDGRPVGRPGPDRAVLFQDPALFPWMTVRRNVDFALELAGHPKERRGALVDEWLAKVHLTRWAEAHPHELSAGMRQRTALARALACRPLVLLADEPFAALDAQTRQVMQVELQRVWVETGTTFVFVTHNVQEAVFLADRVLLLSAPPGTLLEEYRITAPRPRGLEDALLSKVVVDVHEQLQGEVEKVVAREAGRPTGLA